MYVTVWATTYRDETWCEDSLGQEESMYLTVWATTYRDETWCEDSLEQEEPMYVTVWATTSFANEHNDAEDNCSEHVVCQVEGG